MTSENFEKLLGFIKEDILKEHTYLRELIPPEIRVTLTITFLARVFHIKIFLYVSAFTNQLFQNSSQSFANQFLRD